MREIEQSGEVDGMWGVLSSILLGVLALLIYVIYGRVHCYTGTVAGHVYKTHWHGA